jgi:hypothetical protein
MSFNAQYPRIHNKVLKGSSKEEIVDYIAAGVAMSGIV